jgi:hypothetical protein
VFANGNNAALGISYSLWLRMRWVTLGMAIYVAALAIAVQLSSAAMFVASLGIFSLCMALAHLLTVFTLGPTDFGARGSGYPRFMLTLPVRTQSLVGWPMFIGASFIAFIWIVLAVLVLQPAGLPVPTYWPAAVGAAATAWLQAIGWTPFPSPFVRVPALALATLPLILATCAMAMFPASSVAPIALIVASLTWAAVAYATAVKGVALSRAGNDGEWLRLGAITKLFQRREGRASMKVARPAFRSALTAHLWYELRRNACMFPIMFAFVALPISAMLTPSLVAPDARRSLMFGNVVLSPPLIGLFALVSLFLFLGGIYGINMGAFDVWGKVQMPSFFAVRPLTTTRYVFIKIVAVAISALASWGVLIAMLSMWAIVEASSLNPNDSIVRTVAAKGSARDFAVLALLLIGLLAMAFRNQVIGMWCSFAGRKWVSTTMVFLGMFISLVIGLAGYWAYHHRVYLPKLLTYVPWLTGVLLLVKLTAVATLLREFGRRQIATRADVLKLVGLWIAAYLVLLIVGYCFVPLTFTLAAAIALAIPGARIGAAPLALHCNRHR